VLKRKHSELTENGCSWNLSERVSVERPEKDADVLYVVVTQAVGELVLSRRRGNAPHVHLVRGLVETGVHKPARLPAAQVGGVVVVRANVVADALRGCEHLEKLDGMRAPACSVTGKLLEYGHSALAAAEADGVGNFRARAVHGRRDPVDLLVADKVSDIRHHPWCAGLDKKIVVELRDVLFNNGDLLLHDGEQRLQRTRLVAGACGKLRVAQPIESGQKIEKRGADCDRRRAHDIAPSVT
jgi:hypothetical protein